MTDSLQLATLKTISVQEDEGGYTVEAEGKHIPTVCPHCRTEVALDVAIHTVKTDGDRM